MIPPDYTALEREARHRANMLRERHLSVFNGSDLDEREIRRMQEQHDVIAECLVKAADALALAASLQDEIASRDQSIDQLAGDVRFLNAELNKAQDEIERLRGYAQHKEGCATLPWPSEDDWARLCRTPIENRRVVYAELLAKPRPACSCGLAPETGAT